MRYRSSGPRFSHLHEDRIVPGLVDAEILFVRDLRYLPPVKLLLDPLNFRGWETRPNLS